MTKPTLPRATHLGLLALAATILGVSTPAPAQTPAEEAYREGQAALDAGEHRRAAEAFERAAELAPDNPGILLKLGIARGALQDWDGALDAYRRVLAVSPDNAIAHNNIGNIHFRRGDHEAAALAYREALRIKPDYLLAAYHLGWTARQLNRFEEAEAELTRCLSIEPQTPRERAVQVEARFYLGALRFRLRDFEGCAELMEQVVAARPEHPEAHYYLAQSYLRLGRREEAQRQIALHKKITDAADKGGTVATSGGP